jgi:hypothetical protein
LLDVDIDPEKLTLVIQEITKEEGVSETELNQIVEKPKRMRRRRIKKAEVPEASEASLDTDTNAEAVAGTVL